MDLIYGLLNCLTLNNLFYCFIGCMLGTLVGVLPGLGPASTIAILLPITTYLDPTGSIIMLSGLYYGAMYGGSTTSILVNIPGEAASVVTCMDGFQMTKQGRSGQALWVAAIGSFIAGTFGAILCSLLGPGIAKYALKFGPPEYVGLLLFSMTMLITLSASLMKGLLAGLAGMVLATVGMDPLTGAPRLHFGVVGMMRGLELVPVVVGLFGIGEILLAAEQGVQNIYRGKLGKMTPRGHDLKQGLLASIRGTMVGYFPGLIPGMLPALTAFMAYDIEKRVSKYPEKFGTGVIEGVAAPEAANNASAMAGFIPLMTLGIPTSASLAIILAALVMYGLEPGPALFLQNKQFVWTVIGSMYVGNLMLLVLNLPLVGLWARISLIPYKVLGPIILAVCFVGAYSPRNTMFDVWVALIFGIVGFVMKKKGWPLAPLILGFLLGDLFEVSLRQSLSMSGGSLSIFWSRPVAAVLIVCTVIFAVFTIKVLRRVPKELLVEEEKL
ncbi:MAG: tripartite tricarboxylate transporter permease [Thermodesulfobacteriota bacterium]